MELFNTVKQNYVGLSELPLHKNSLTYDCVDLHLTHSKSLYGRIRILFDGQSLCRYKDQSYIPTHGARAFLAQNRHT